jgi:O-methyltransferase
MDIRGGLQRSGLTRNRLRWISRRRVANDWFVRPRFTAEQRRSIVVAAGDPVRYGTLLLAMEQIRKTGVAGALAECGVYRGNLSKFLHEQMTDRTLYLFDTFEGFDHRDSDSGDDLRFRDTSERQVLDFIGDSRNLIVRKGYFPETARGLEEERFALSVLDFDKFEPTVAALEFFYHRTSPGGFVFVHDYSSPESDWACSKALDSFLADKAEHPLLIPDAWGTAFFRKI